MTTPTLREAAQAIIDYSTTGAPDFPEWEAKYEALRAALAAEPTQEPPIWEKVMKIGAEAPPEAWDCLTPTPPQTPMTDHWDMCPNCVKPWKCNGPHIPPMTDTERHAARYVWLRRFHARELLQCAWQYLEAAKVGADCDEAIDAAMRSMGIGPARGE